MLDEFERLRNRRTLLAAEEGDPVLYTESGRVRANPLKVTDTGGNEEDGYYIVVQGPRSGTYTIREDPTEPGYLTYDTNNGKIVTNLRFADVDDDVRASYREEREAALSHAYELMASDDYDYAEFAAAAADAAADQVSAADASDRRVMLLGAPRRSFDVDAYGNAPHSDAAGRLAYATLFADIADAGQQYAGGRSPEGDITDNDDLARLLDEAVAALNSVVDVKGEGDLEDDAYEVAAAILDDLPTADHIALIELIPSRAATNRPVPYGDREQAHERALARFQRELLEEYHTRERQSLIGDRESQPLDELLDDTEEGAVDTDALLEEVQPTVPNLPLMPDEKMPHTTVDEATYFFGEDIPIVAGEWRMCDSGIVLDGASRKLCWENGDGEFVIIAGANEGETNRWRTLTMNDHLRVLVEGSKFKTALDAAIDYMVGGKDRDRPEVRIIDPMEPDGGIVVEQNVNRENFGRRILKRDGFFSNAFGSIFDATGRAAGRAAGLVGGAVTHVAGRFWARYDEDIADLVLSAFVTVLIANASKLLLGSESGVEYSQDPADAKVFARYDRGGMLTFDIERNFPTFFERGKRAATFALGYRQEEGEDIITAAMGGPEDASEERKASVTGGSGEGMSNTTTLPKTTGSKTSRRDDPKPMGANTPETKQSDGGTSWPSQGETGGMRPSEAADADTEEFAERLGIDDKEVARATQDKGKILNAAGDALTRNFDLDASLTEAAASLTGEDMNPSSAEEVVDEAKDADRVEQLELPANETDVEVDAADVEPTGRTLSERMADVDADEQQQWRDLATIHEDAEAIRRYEGSEETEDFDVSEAVDNIDTIRAERTTRERQEAEESFNAAERERQAEEAAEFAEREGFFEDENRDPAADT